MNELTEFIDLVYTEARGYPKGGHRGLGMGGPARDVVFRHTTRCPAVCDRVPPHKGQGRTQHYPVSQMYKNTQKHLRRRIPNILDSS